MKKEHSFKKRVFDTKNRLKSSFNLHFVFIFKNLTKTI